MRDSVRALAILVSLGVVGMVATRLQGCAELTKHLQQQCQSVEDAYHEKLRAEKTELKKAQADAQKTDGQTPPQFGLTLSNALMSDIVNTVVQPVLKGALKAVSTVKVAGQNVELDTRGDILELGFESDSACDHCFRVSGRLDGAVTARLPMLGARTANLNGSFKIVAPLLLEEGEDKAAAIKLDLAQLVGNGSSALTTRLSGLPNNWASRLTDPLSDMLMTRLKTRLKPVTLVEFEGPSFGIDGFRLTPVEWKTDSQNKSVFAGFSTNIEALSVPGAKGIAPVTKLADDQNIALAFQPKLVVHALSLLITGGKVSRTYTSSGKAAKDGGMHVTLSNFGVGADAIRRASNSDSRIEEESRNDAPDTGGSGDTGADGQGDAAAKPDLPMALGFSIHQFQRGGVCFSGTAQAAGGLSVRDNKLKMTLNDVHFTSSTVPGGLVDIANWASAEFVQKSRTLVEQSLDRDSMQVPGSTLSLGPVGVELLPNTVVLRGKSQVKGE